MAKNKGLCSALIPNQRWAEEPRRCFRAARKDGFCYQHHPESKAARKEKARERYEKKLKERIEQTYGPSAIKCLKEISEADADGKGGRLAATWLRKAGLV